MRVCNYLEFERRLQRCGIGTATAQQRKALASTGVEVVTEPWVGDDASTCLQSLATSGQLFREYDLVHCNFIGPGTIAVARHARRNDVPLVLHAHVTHSDFADSLRGTNYVAPALDRFLRWFYSQADLLLCPTEYTKRVLEGYPVEAPLLPISNGIDRQSLEGYEALREEYRARFDLDGLVVFAIGNVVERKGLTTFCRVAQETDYEFAWFGKYDTGPEGSAAVKRWVTDPPENVTFTGWIDDKRGAFGAGDVFLFPTKTEQQGIAVLEAMACGKPVVLRDLPVFEEYTHGEDCLKCTSFAEFRDAIERLADDPDLRERLGERARETAAGHDLERLGERLRTAYEDAVAGRTEVTTP